MHLCDVGLMLVSYVLLRPVSKNLALLAVLFNLVQTSVLVANKLNLMTPVFPRLPDRSIRVSAQGSRRVDGDRRGVLSHEQLYAGLIANAQRDAVPGHPAAAIRGGIIDGVVAAREGRRSDEMGRTYVVSALRRT
jgi:uncharacterized protein DUF4386